MKKRGNFLLVLLCCLMLVTLAACGKNNNSADNDENVSGTPAPERDTLTVAISGDNGTLNPYGITGSFIGVVRQYMETLIDYKPARRKSGSLQPTLKRSPLHNGLFISGKVSLSQMGTNLTPKTFGLPSSIACPTPYS